MQTLILGTAQWGLDYGITNSSGRLSDDTLLDLVAEARDAGISVLDTAPGYGDAESRIGRVGTGFAVQSKVSCHGVGAEEALGSVRASLERTGAPRLASLLVHDWPDLGPAERELAGGVLARAREDGLVGLVGVSAYDEEDLASALRGDCLLDVVQVPVSILDQRLVDSPAIASLRGNGTVIQGRSIFLQGVALGEDEQAPFADHPAVVALREWRSSQELSPMDACTGYVRSLPWLDEVVVAAVTAGQLGEIVRSWSATGADRDWPRYPSLDPHLLDPRRWPAPGGRPQGGS